MMPRTPGATVRVPTRGGRYRAWQTMRLFRKAGADWTLRELAAAAGTGPDNVRRMIRELAARDIVRCVRPKRNGALLGDARWRLVRDLGPEPPVIRKGGGIYDPNSGEELP